MKLPFLPARPCWRVVHTGCYNVPLDFVQRYAAHGLLRQSRQHRPLFFSLVAIVRDGHWIADVSLVPLGRRLCPLCRRGLFRLLKKG